MKKFLKTCRIFMLFIFSVFITPTEQPLLHPNRACQLIRLKITLVVASHGTGVALLSAPDTWVLHGPSCRRDLSMCFKVILVRKLKRWSPDVKRIAALISASIGFVALVRNWYLPLFIRFSPFASMDTEALVTTRNGLKFFLRPKMGDLSILNEILRHELYSQQSSVNGTVVNIGAHIGVFTRINERVKRHCDLL